MGLQLGYSDFARNQSNCDYVRMYYGLSMNINMHESPHGVQRSWKYFVCICFYMCVQPKPGYSQLELITQGGIRDLGSSFSVVVTHV